MAKEVAYVKKKVNEILTNEDLPVMGKDIDLINKNQKILLKRTERLIWAFSGLLILQIFLHFFF
jgi:hypothetical protein